MMKFLFIVAVPLVLVAGAVVTLFAVGAAFGTLDDPRGLRAVIEGAFRKPQPPPRPLEANHYYQAPWAKS